MDVSVKLRTLADEIKDAAEGSETRGEKIAISSILRFLADGYERDIKTAAVVADEVLINFADAVWELARERGEIARQRQSQQVQGVLV